MAPTTEPALVNVDADGDLILRVGAAFKEDEVIKKKEDGKNKTQTTENKVNATKSSKVIRICVSSKFMTMCSPVFKAMFTGRFNEGQISLSTTSPPTVDLPEDRPDATLTLCQVLHYKKEANDATCFSQAASVALVSDKYNCEGSVKPWFSHQLLSKRRDGTPLTASDLAQGLSASYLLNDGYSFLEFSTTAAYFLPRDLDSTTFDTGILPCLRDTLICAHQKLYET